MSTYHFLLWRNSNKSVSFPQDVIEKLVGKNLVIVPINIDNKHWIVAVLRIDQGEIDYYDSMNYKRSKEDTRILLDLMQICLSLKKDHKTKPKVNDIIGPKQTDEGSCGVFSLLYSFNAAKRKDQKWNSTIIPVTRLEWALKIIVSFIVLISIIFQ